MALPRLLTEINAMSIYASAPYSARGLMIASPVAGKFSDTLGRKWLTVISLAAYLVCVGRRRPGTDRMVPSWYAGVKRHLRRFLHLIRASIIADVTDMKERPKYYDIWLRHRLSACWPGLCWPESWPMREWRGRPTLWEFRWESCNRHLCNVLSQ